MHELLWPRDSQLAQQVCKFHVYLVTLLHFPICYPVCGLFAVNSCFDMGALYLILLSFVLNLECKKGTIRRFLPVPALLQSKELVRFHFVSPLLSFLLHVVRLLRIVLMDGKRLMAEFFQQTVLNSNNGLVVTESFFFFQSCSFSFLSGY